jgi:hypothetical protein
MRCNSFADRCDFAGAVGQRDNAELFGSARSPRIAVLAASQNATSSLSGRRESSGHRCMGLYSTVQSLLGVLRRWPARLKIRLDRDRSEPKATCLPVAVT